MIMNGKTMPVPSIDRNVPGEEQPSFARESRTHFVIALLGQVDSPGS